MTEFEPGDIYGINPDIIDLVPSDYEGSCKVVLEGCYSKEIVIVPNKKSATEIAKTAVQPCVGGYGGAEIISTNEPVTHDSFIEWFM